MIICRCNSLVSRVVDHIFCSCLSLRQLCSVTGNVYTLVQNKSTDLRVFCGKMSILFIIIEAKTNVVAIQGIKNRLL